jgi:hypothetical protein
VPGTELDAALAPLLDLLRADGYDGRYEERDGRILFEISASEDACSECLSPKAVMERVVRTALRRAGHDVEVDLRYPSDPR